MPFFAPIYLAEGEEAKNLIPVSPRVSLHAESQKQRSRENWLSRRDPAVPLCQELNSSPTPTARGCAFLCNGDKRTNETFSQRAMAVPRAREGAGVWTNDLATTPAVPHPLHQLHGISGIWP